jgi:NTE family protein
MPCCAGASGPGGAGHHVGARRRLRVQGVRAMAQSKSKSSKETVRRVAIGCQGGGMHAAFEVGVLTEILEHLERQNDPEYQKQKEDRFELVGLSGTSAGALCALITWYGLVKKNGSAGSLSAAARDLNRFWNEFTANTAPERALNTWSSFVFSQQETERLGFVLPMLGVNPRSAFSRAVTAGLPYLGVRRQYYDLIDLLKRFCPQFDNIDWDNLKTRLMVGASEIMNGIETVFDSDLKMRDQGGKHTHPTVSHRWRQRRPLSLQGVAASGTLPTFRPSERIEGGVYWDGLYSQNPPVREFVASVHPRHVPDEIWIIRINPQQCAQVPESIAEIEDRQNELMGNLSLNKELDFVLTVNDWIRKYPARYDEKQKKEVGFGADYKPVTVRTIKMRRELAAELRYSSKFDRSRAFVDRLREEGHAVARQWLDQWPNVGCYPDDAGYYQRP